MYAWEKFYLAAKALEEASAQPRKSLENTFIDNILMLREADIPAELLAQFREINSLLTLPEGVSPLVGHSGDSHAISALSDCFLHEEN